MEMRSTVIERPVLPNKNLMQDSKRSQTPLEKAIALGKIPYAPTNPPIYMCGHCRNVQVKPDRGVCPDCYVMLIAREAELEPTEWILGWRPMAALTVGCAAVAWFFVMVLKNMWLTGK